MVFAKLWVGVGVHPTIHRLVLRWGMVAFTIIGVGGATWAFRRFWRGELRGPIDLASAWLLGTAGIIGFEWFAAELLQLNLIPRVCVREGSDYGACYPHPIEVWLAVWPALVAGVVALWLAAAAASVHVTHPAYAWLVMPPVWIGATLAVAAVFVAVVVAVSNVPVQSPPFGGPEILVAPLATGAVVSGAMMAWAYPRPGKLRRTATAALTWYLLTAAGFAVGAAASLAGATGAAVGHYANQTLFRAAAGWGWLFVGAAAASIVAVGRFMQSRGRLRALMAVAFVVVVCAAVGVLAVETGVPGPGQPWEPTP